MALQWKLRIEGMTCEHCEVSVRRALESAGARNVQADFRRGEAVFEAEETADPERWREAIRKAGYRPGELSLLGRVGSVEAVSQERPVHGRTRRDAYDLVIVGSGSAAFAAAIRARDLGARVLMVEAGTLGGTCVNVGCVPSKFLLRAAEVYHLARHHGYAGIPTQAGPVDWRALVAQKDELVRALRKEKYADLVELYGWELVQGRAQFVDAETLAVDGRTVRASAYIVATGASPAVPPIEGLVEAGYLTSTTAMELEALPTSLAVIGANAIGLEMGQLFARLGVRVTLIEIMPRIAPFEEPEVSEALAAALQEEGIEVLTAAQVRRVERTPVGKRLWVQVGGELRSLEVADVLVATGRRPNTEGLGLDQAGVKTDRRGAIVVDEFMQTTNPRVWAAGDCTGSPQFVYVAAYEGTVAAENALGSDRRRVDLSVVPRITFTTPTVAAVGLTEAQARAQGYEVRTTVMPVAVLARAWVNRDTRGLFKLVADAATDRLLGVHVVADNAGEVIYAAQLALQAGLRVGDLAATLAPYLTMAEGLRLAAQSFGRDVARMSCCAG
ncbi:Mercuric reductase [bacterium HR11]|nr:Mercuric reductase [bacterium HR11]